MISVVIPVYNVEDYLPQCLDSVISQSYTNLEIILIDDGSRDSSGKICDEYALRDSRIRVIHQQNQGLSAARNAGIEIATGAYILFLDSDDCLPAGSLNHLRTIASDREADYVAGTFNRLKEDGQLIPARLRDPINGIEVYTERQKMENYICVPKQSNSVCGKLFARELFSEIRFPVGKLFEDIFVTYRLVHAAKCIALSQEPSYIYRWRANSIMHRSCSRRDFDAVEGRLGEQRFVLEHYPDMEHHTNVRVFSTAFALLIRSANGGLGDRELDRRIQILMRKHLRNYLKCRANRKKKLLATIAFCNINLARFVIRTFAQSTAED